MGTIILHKLEPKLRIALQDRRCIDLESSAFIGITDDDLSRFGIGLLNKKGQPILFWTTVRPHQLITAWRGMHLLDKATSIFRSTIYYAYCAGIANREEADDVKTAVAELSEQIPDFQEHRDEIFRMKINDAILDSMLKICNNPDSGVDLDENELKKAVKADIIHQTTEVSHVYEIAARKQLAIKRAKEISKQPLPESKSFRKFCENYDIKNLCGNPYDDYPVYRSAKYIDEILVYNGLRFQGVEEVWCAKNPQHSPHTGHIGQPVLLLNDQRIVVLSYVCFKENDMWCAIHPAKGKDEDEWLTLSSLSTLAPQFVGLTFDHDDKPKPEDMLRGFFTI